MTRHVFLQIALPGLIVGAILLGTCLLSAWYINHLQANLSQVLSREVISLEASQELEICVRQLRYHCFLYLTDPRKDPLARKDLLAPIEKDNQGFETALDLARAKASPQEGKLIRDIDEGYHRYRAELDELRHEIDAGGPRRNMAELANSHPIRHVVEPCQELLRINKASIENTAQETERFTAQARLAMLLLGALGPLGGLVIGYIMMQRQQRHQRAMLRAEQLAAVGQLAAGVAHEVRNPLAAIKMLVEAALRPKNSTGPDPPSLALRAGRALSEQDLQVIHSEIVRLEKIVQGFLDFARLPTLRRSPCDLREVVDKSVDLIRARSRQQNVAVALRSPETPVRMFVDGEQIRTVFVNLLLNALDAMPQGGRVEVNVSVDAAGSARVVFADTGHGISAEIAGQLFTPFASTKPTGTGLGLSLSKRIVEEHGGSLTADNRPEGGARFTLVLPAVGQALLPVHAEGI